ncbi:mechanosensitive ion channel family protein [Aestuariivivens marinum]|uniref:mechanosensitive ion channel family protein n=1 Tax=Aestuariivivens marinum TaxID=2913555 RepID=UPI001F587764|nr:mechanosensitive ion channel domain-containing protein [Aestuariivivens marinum]
MKDTRRLLFDYLLETGINQVTAKYLNMFALLLVLLIILYLTDFLIRKLVRVTFINLARKTRTHFDDLLITNKVPRNIAHIIPLLIALEFIPHVLFQFEWLENIVEKGLKVFAIILTLWIVRSLLNTLEDYFKTLPRLKDKPVDSYIQVFMIFAWIFGVFGAFAIVSNIKFLEFLAGIGTASAIILLIFKDTILGFVASIQVSINDMVRIGDWITFEKFGADGDVIEINLATVKVQNFDKTITTIPTYALISDSFKNWRGMVNSDGRRIKRALIIELNSISYLSKNEIDKLKSVQLISEYLNTRQKDIETYNENHNIDKSLLLNGRNLTNIGVFRKYVESYIEKHSAVNKDMIIMTRQLEPTTQGLPLEIYCFSKDKRWQNYEYIMADIFDHLIAAVPYFNLRLYELPTSTGFGTIQKKSQ